MPSGEHVGAGGELAEQRHLVPGLGGPLEVGVAAAAHVELVERVVHAAVLGAQHHAGVGEGRHPAVQVLAEALGHLEREVTGAVVDVLVDVEQAGEHLVEVVVGDDHRVVGGAAALDGVQRGVAERAQVAGAAGAVVGVLHLGEALDGVDDPVMELLLGRGVVGAGVRHREGRHVMPERVAAEVAAHVAVLPAGVPLGGRGRQAGRAVEPVEELVRAQVEQVLVLLGRRVGEVLVGEEHVEARVAQRLAGRGHTHLEGAGDLVAVEEADGGGERDDGVVVAHPGRRDGAVGADHGLVARRPGDLGAAGAGDRQRQGGAGHRRHGDLLEVGLGDVLAIDGATGALVEGDDVLGGGHAVEHHELVEGRAEVRAVVLRAVEADRLRQRRGAGDHSGGGAADAVRHHARNPHAVAVEGRLLAVAAVGDGDVSPLAHREERGAVGGGDADLVRLRASWAHREGERGGAGLRGEVPAVTVVGLLVPGDHLLAGHGGVRLEPERHAELGGLERRAGAEVEVGAPGELHRLVAVLADTGHVAHAGGGIGTAHRDRVRRRRGVGEVAVEVEREHRVADAEQGGVGRCREGAQTEHQGDDRADEDGGDPQGHEVSSPRAHRGLRVAVTVATGKSVSANTRGVKGTAAIPSNG